MKNDSEEPEVTEKEPDVKPKLSIVVILSMLLGILLTMGGVGAFLCYQKSQTLHSEIVALKTVLTQKSLEFDEVKAQIEIFSKQIHALKDYSIARSIPPGEKENKKESPVSVVNTADNAPKLPGAIEKTGSTEKPNLPKAKKPKPDAQNCELVGKSPEEQAATLKRCVSLIETPSEKPRGR